MRHLLSVFCIVYYSKTSLLSVICGCVPLQNCIRKIVFQHFIVHSHDKWVIVVYSLWPSVVSTPCGLQLHSIYKLLHSVIIVCLWVIYSYFTINSFGNDDMTTCLLSLVKILDAVSSFSDHAVNLSNRLFLCEVWSYSLSIHSYSLLMTVVHTFELCWRSVFVSPPVGLQLCELLLSCTRSDLPGLTLIPVRSVLEASSLIAYPKE